MTNNKSIFELPEDKANNLGIYKQKTKPTLRDRFIKLFRVGKEEGKKSLTLEQLVCGYYNLFTEPNNERILPRHLFTQRLRYWLPIYYTSYERDREKIKSENIQKPFLIKHYVDETYELVE